MDEQDLKHPYPRSFPRLLCVGDAKRQLESEIEAAGIPRFKSSLAERLAYKAIFVERLSLAELGDYKVGNLEAAAQNIHELATELVETLQGIEKGSIQ